MYFYIAKLAPLFVLPLGLVLVLAATALACLLGQRKRLAAALLASAMLMLWISSMPVVAFALYARLEGHYPPMALDALPVSRCIVLLGGAVGGAVPPGADIELNEAVDRVYKASRLYRAGKGRIVIVTAGNQPWSSAGPTEASLIGELLVAWGVPPDALRLEGRSRNTRENALNAKPLLRANDCAEPLLVTSAAHMVRAVRAFRTVGVTVVPVPVDFRARRGAVLSVLDFLPDAHALAMTSDALREWMGRKVYEWRGWN